MGLEMAVGELQEEISDERSTDQMEGSRRSGAVARESIKLISQFFSVPLLSGRG